MNVERVEVDNCWHIRGQRVFRKIIKVFFFFFPFQECSALMLGGEIFRKKKSKE